MKPRNQALLIISGGILFVILGVWWLALPGMSNGAFVWLLGGVAFLIGGFIKLRRSTS